jgi:hypothetical protein
MTSLGRAPPDVGRIAPGHRDLSADALVVVDLDVHKLGEHYRPAEARRWTETHVMVGLYRTDPDTGRRKDQLAWLRAEDVYRVLRAADVKQG